MAEMSAIRTFLTAVVAVEDVHPHLRRITFGGDDLATFTPVGPTPSSTCCCRRRPDRADDRPGLHVGGLRGDGRGGAAARRVLHACAAGAPSAPSSRCCSCSTATKARRRRWAARRVARRPGCAWGPRHVRRAARGHRLVLVLVADERGCPRWRRSSRHCRRDGRSGVRGGRRRARAPGAALVTFVRGDVAAPRRRRASTTSLLADAVRALPGPGARRYAWGGGESRAVTAVRRYLRDEVGLRREAVSMTGYWRSDAGL